MPAYLEIAQRLGCSPAQLSIAWVLAQDEHIHAIPGTTKPAHFKDDLGAMDLLLSADVLKELDELINQETVSGPRYPAGVQVEIDTEEFTA